MYQPYVRKNIFLTRHELAEGTRSLAMTISAICQRECRGAIIYCVLDGAFMFTADLVRYCRDIVDVRFVHVRRNYPTPDDDPSIFPPLVPQDFLSKYVYFFVDIVTEEGVTFRKLFRSAGRKQNVFAIALINKGGSRRKNVFTHFDCPKESYLYGYGMAPHRHLSYVGKMRREDV